MTRVVLFAVDGPLPQGPDALVTWLAAIAGIGFLLWTAVEQWQKRRRRTRDRFDRDGRPRGGAR